MDICSLCNKECVIGENKVGCMGPCHKRFHAKCVGFTPVSYKFYKECDNLYYECDECSNNPNKVISATLDKILSFMSILNERLNRQETNCDTMFKHFETLHSNLEKYASESKADIEKAAVTVNNGSNTSSYNEIAKPTVLDPVVLVQPKTIQKCTATRADLDKKNIPNEIAIDCVNNLSKGVIEIKCKNNSEQSKLHEIASKELGEDYNVIIPKLRNPKIRVTNMSVKQNNVDIIECIKKQNEFVKDAEMKVLHLFENKYNETYGAIVEVDPRSFNVLMKEQKIVIGGDKCHITESLSVLRCYKCCGYNHKSTTCKNKKACLRCGGEHEIKECTTSRAECINCKVAAEKFGSKFDCDHPAWSKTCAVLRRNIEKEKHRVRYDQWKT